MTRGYDGGSAGLQPDRRGDFSFSGIATLWPRRCLPCDTPFLTIFRLTWPDLSDLTFETSGGAKK